MRPLYLFRHIRCEGPGYLASVLERHAVPWELIRIDAGDPVPENVDDCSGLVFMGGPMSVNDPLPWIEQELALIRLAHDRGMPVLGHCLGGQLICRALGGSVGANPAREVGWHPVRKTGHPLAASWLGDIPDGTRLFHWHGETFSVPDGAALILENDNCAHQAFASGNTLALQCHVEMTADMVREWLALYADELRDPAPSVQSATQMIAHLDADIASARRAADAIYGRWLEPLTGA